MSCHGGSYQSDSRIYRRIVTRPWPPARELERNRRGGNVLTLTITVRVTSTTRYLLSREWIARLVIEWWHVHSSHSYHHPKPLFWLSWLYLLAQRKYNSKKSFFHHFSVLDRLLHPPWSFHKDTHGPLSSRNHELLPIHTISLYTQSRHLYTNTTMGHRVHPLHAHANGGTAVYQKHSPIRAAPAHPTMGAAAATIHITLTPIP